MWEVIVRRPVLIQAVIQAGIGLGMGFGLTWSTEQMGLILAFSAAILALVAETQTAPTADNDIAATIKRRNK